MQLLNNITALLGLIEIATIQQQFVKIIADISEATAAEQRAHTLIYMSDERITNGSKKREQLDLFKLLHTQHLKNPIAVVNTDSNASNEQYAEQFNHKLLSIVQLSEDTHHNEQILDKLWQRLDRNRQSGLILLFKDTANEVYVSRILKNCVKKHAINVIALQQNMAVIERSYWTLQMFPKHQTIRRSFTPKYRNLFPKHQENMHGYPLRIMGNGWHPQMYNFTPKHGPTTLSGYLGSALSEYAYRRNATINSIYPQNHKVLYFTELCEMLLNDSADTGPLWPVHIRDYELSFSNAVHRFDLCLMIPLEQAIPKYTLYYHIFDKTAVILFCVSQVLISCILTLLSRWRGRQRQLDFNDFLNISVLEGLLGMPFSTTQRSTFIHKLIYIIISIGGVNIGTAYNAYLQSFNVDPPIEPISKTLDDILKRGIKLALDEQILPLLIGSGNIPIDRQKFTIFSNYTELLMLRDSLDTGYAFPVTNMWYIYEEQQKYFTRPLFRLTDICFRKNTPLVLPFQPNSVYRDSLTEFLDRLLAAGLIKFWLRHSFIELVSMNKVLLEDRNKQEHFKPMKLADLQAIIIIMGVFVTASFFCFVLELIWQRAEELFKSMIQIKRRIFGRIINRQV